MYISSQNHGYAVVSDSINPALAEEWFVNVNDRTCEGILVPKLPRFLRAIPSGACGGPQDTEMLFENFIAMMEVKKHAAQ